LALRGRVSIEAAVAVTVIPGLTRDPVDFFIDRPLDAGPVRRSLVTKTDRVRHDGDKLDDCANCDTASGNQVFKGKTLSGTFLEPVHIVKQLQQGLFNIFQAIVRPGKITLQTGGFQKFSGQLQINSGYIAGSPF
jgi:hypothetical protein